MKWCIIVSQGLQWSVQAASFDFVMILDGKRPLDEQGPDGTIPRIPVYICPPSRSRTATRGLTCYVCPSPCTSTSWRSHCTFRARQSLVELRRRITCLSLLEVSPYCPARRACISLRGTPVRIEVQTSTGTFMIKWSDTTTCFGLQLAASHSLLG